MGLAGAASSGGEEAGGPRTWTRRQLINGIRWRTRAGTPWRDAPERYGLWDRIYDLFRRWQRDVTWKRILEQLQVQADAQGLIAWHVSVDSAVCRGRQEDQADKAADRRAEEPGP
ncbi:MULTISPECIES: transposase [Streptomyces]|uniref:transposase n=1 Tax=Streptomyces TaxID=1883 RepID=UPI001EFB44C5|nr:transposase [Streptomyces sp. SceaMP-e96]